MDATTTSYAVESQPGQDLDRGVGPLLRHALAAVRRNIWLIAAIMVLAVVAAVILTMLQTPRYTAMATVEINEQAAHYARGECEEVTAVTYVRLRGIDELQVCLVD